MRIPGARQQERCPGRVGKRELRRDPPSDSALYAVRREGIGVDDADGGKSCGRCYPGGRSRPMAASHWV